MKLSRVLVAVVVTLVLVGTTASLWAAPPDRRPAYLALGDSITFGFITADGFAYVNPANFIGYPGYDGHTLHLPVTNAACPGETTSSFLSATAPDNGCRAFRANFPLHESYTGTQLDFATAFLSAHPKTQLVTIGLGGNDLLLLQANCANDLNCIVAGLPAALATVVSNLHTAITALRSAGFKGVIVLVNLFSPDYTNALDTQSIAALNQTITAVAATSPRTTVADVFLAFQIAASGPFAAGQTCKAGLLNASPQNQLDCDVHPSQSGQQLIAKTVFSAYVAALRAK